MATPEAFQRRLCASVLFAESLVVFFALLVARSLSDLSWSVVGGVGGGIAVACLLLAGLLRYQWAYVAASVLQVLLILSGFVVPVMFFLGAVFAALWVLCLVLGRRVRNGLSPSAQPTPPAAPEAITFPPDPKET